MGTSQGQPRQTGTSAASVLFPPALSKGNQKQQLLTSAPLRALI